MADRGRKANPVSSAICEERWRKKEAADARKRLAKVRKEVDTSQPVSLQFKTDVFNNPKKQQQMQMQQEKIDTANKFLLEKLIKIRATDTASSMRPFLGRSTFQWGAGQYYDPVTNLKCVDHVNTSMCASPRSIHHHQHVRQTGSVTFADTQRSMSTLLENSRILRRINGVVSAYDVGAMEEEHEANQGHVLRLSMFRGPRDAYFMPESGTGHAPSRPSSASPYCLRSHASAPAPRSSARPYSAVSGSLGSPRAIRSMYGLGSGGVAGVPARVGSAPAYALRPSTAISASEAASAAPPWDDSPVGEAARPSSGVCRSPRASIERVEYSPPSALKRAHHRSGALSRAGFQSQQASRSSSTTTTPDTAVLAAAAAAAAAAALPAPGLLPRPPSQVQSPKPTTRPMSRAGSQAASMRSQASAMLDHPQQGAAVANVGDSASLDAEAATVADSAGSDAETPEAAGSDAAAEEKEAEAGASEASVHADADDDAEPASQPSGSEGGDDFKEAGSEMPEAAGVEVPEAADDEEQEAAPADEEDDVVEEDM
ncbi:hypothetical protein FOA52_005127 [Chlamydomonas sp. UWO 241]|nr:hypothetical protein FOA52_005127 [Chlamydomonas sp. UWO 241]